MRIIGDSPVNWKSSHDQETHIMVMTRDGGWKLWCQSIETDWEDEQCRQTGEPVVFHFEKSNISCLHCHKLLSQTFEIITVAEPKKLKSWRGEHVCRWMWHDGSRVRVSMNQEQAFWDHREYVMEILGG